MLYVVGSFVCFFFFKQKTAYEIMPSLVGSEMCIRDSRPGRRFGARRACRRRLLQRRGPAGGGPANGARRLRRGAVLVAAGRLAVPVSRRPPGLRGRRRRGWPCLRRAYTISVRHLTERSSL